LENSSIRTPVGIGKTDQYEGSATQIAFATPLDIFEKQPVSRPIYGCLAIPKAIVTRWNQEVAKVLGTDSMKRWIAQEGLESAGPPEEFLNRIRSDVEKWKRLVKEADIKTVG